MSELKAKIQYKEKKESDVARLWRHGADRSQKTMER